jgi:sialidase-1
MMFSDDAGQSWQLSAPIKAGANECQVIEREDGSLLVNARMQGNFEGFRGIATSDDGGATWSEISQEKQLPCPKCQGSLLRCDEHRLLVSNPFPPAPVEGKTSGARVNLTIRSSTDDGKTWPVAKRLHEGPSAYSTLARLPDGAILCLYETGEKGAYKVLRLARFNLEWLTAPVAAGATK